jgi:ribose transport system permease protein
MTATKPEMRPTGFAHRLARWIDWIVVALILAVLVVVSVTVTGFLTEYNISNLLLQSSYIGILAIGEAFVLITGGIDLSSPAIMAMGAVVGAGYIVAHPNQLVLGILIMVVIGVACGIVNGLLVAYVKLVPFIATLATSTLLGGLALWITHSASIAGLPNSFLNLAGSLGSIPIPVIVFAVVIGLSYILLAKTVLGRHIFYIGVNARAARVASISVERTQVMAYAISGLSAGIAAVVLTAILGTATAAMGQGTIQLAIISAAVIGGVSIYGGVGSIPGVVLGTLLLTLIGNVMSLNNVSYFTTYMVKGAVIVVAVSLDRFRRLK